MKIGVFDSGLGGLLIAKAIRKTLPAHDMIYLGDTLHMPYGSRSADAIHDYTLRSVEYLFAQNCALIVIACNTASARALRRIQQEWLPGAYPDRRVLGVIVPTLETASEKNYKHLGVIATSSIVKSDIFRVELMKVNPDLKLTQTETPLLAPMIDHGGLPWIDPVLEHYIDPMVEKGIDCLLLGCTHYPVLKDKIRAVVGEGIDILSQDDIIPAKLEDYLKRHPEIDKRISRGGTTRFAVTDRTASFESSARGIYGSDIVLERVEI